MSKARIQFESRRIRTRASLRRKSAGRLRLSVFRSGQHIYGQIIDDKEGKTLAAASTTEKEVKASVKNNGATVAAAAVVGKLVAERALKAGVKEVCFDRGGYVYHGRVKALAEAAREAGLSF